MITPILIAALLQTAAINSQRDKFLSCLDRGTTSAQAQKMPADAVEAHLRQTCAAAEASLEGSLIAFDVKNKVARKQAAADARLQTSDFLSSSVARYKPAAAAK